MIARKLFRHAGNVAVYCFFCLPGSRRLADELITARMNKLLTTTHKGQTMKFVDANHLCSYRAKSFATKEPDTLEWIETIPEGSVLWDVGANVGLYSIYAAKQRKCRVYAFEPSVFNLELLARNIFANNLHNLVTIVPIALTDEFGVNLFRMTSTNWGGALSTFGKKFDQNGQDIIPLFEYRIVGVPMSDAVSRLGIPFPNFIKIDVDGIEHLVLRGGCDILKKVDSVLIEINDDFKEQSEHSTRLLAISGLSLFRKRQMVAGQHNQWWIRRGA